MPDLSDISKENVNKGKMGGSASNAGDKFSRNPYNHDDEKQLTAEERKAVSIERPSRPIPPNRPLPVLSESASEPRKNSLKSKEYIIPLDGTSSASSSPGMSQRKHTPATIPRTKFTSATPLEQRIAINSLRQKLDYEEAEKGESNRRQSKKEVRASKKIELAASTTCDDKASVSSMTESQTASQLESETSDVVDTTRIVQRLTQVQDYLKQATSLYVNLSTKVHLEDSEMDHIEKLGKLIQQLRLQEQGYVDLLQRTLDVDESADISPSSSVLSLRQEETQAHIDGNQQQELEKLQMQHALLKKIVDQQQQIQDLKRKQATLTSLQEQAEDLIRSADDTEDQTFSRIWKEESKEEGAMTAASAYIATDATPHDEIDDEGTALFDADMVQRKLELESKLMSLQAKKEKMDSLLSTLKASRDTIEGASSSQTALKLNSENGPHASNQQTIHSKRVEIEQQQQNAVQAMQQAKDLQDKLQKLKEVKKRLEDLTDIVAEYEESHVQPILSRHETSAEDKQPHCQVQAGYGGARPRDDASSVPLNADHNSKDMTNGLDNRMRPAPPGGRSQRTAIDVTRNPSSRDIKSSSVANGASALGKNLATEDQDNDLSSKIKQLQEARQRLAFIQQNTQLLTPSTDKNEQAIVSSARETESESESESVSTAEDLSWQEDPEFQAKVRRLQQAKEKLKHLQELVNSVQQDGLVMDELANISLSSKEPSAKEEEDDEDDFDNEEADEDGEITSERQSDENKEDDDSETSSATEEEKIEDGATCEETEENHLSDAAVNFDKELEYQTKLKQQKQELEKLLLEKQKLLDAQRQLSEIARSTLATENETANQGKEKLLKDVKRQPKIKFDGESEEKLPLRPAIVGKDVNRVKYEGIQVPRIVKRTSNLSVEPQYGSDSDIRGLKKRNFLHARKKQTGPSLGSRPNPLVMSELRRQREMFEQNKKLKFVEKQRRIRDSGDDNRSDGGTYSIRSDLDEGVGHSMFSADVTTAATWGGSTEQSSSEEDSAVGEEDFPEEEVEIDDEYEGNMDQPEEEEEEDGRIDEELEGDDVAPLLDLKAKIGKQKSEKTWFRTRDRVENHSGKKRKLDTTRNRSTVSWSMNVSPDSSTRQRERQLNLTPAHKLMRERTSRKPDASNSLWEEQCELLRQQLTSSTSLSTSLLRNQQTLLTMLQNQTGPIGSFGGEGFRFDSPFTQFPHGPLASGLGFQRSTHQQQQQQQQQILHTLERCTNQLDRQHQEIQSLQREFHNMLLRQSAEASTRRVYAWDEHAPAFGNYDQRKAFSADARNQNESFLGSTYKTTVTYPPSGPIHVFGDESQSRFTQTEIPPSQPMKRNEYGLAGEPSNQQLRDTNFGQFFRLNEFRQGATQSTMSTAHVDERSSNSKQPDAEYNPLIYADSELTSGAKVDAVSRSRDVISTSYPTPSKSKAAMDLAERQRATWPSFLKETENIDSQSERSASNYGEKRDMKEEKVKEEVKETEDKLERLSVASNFSLFETMRDSIYSEVATLISMNESRPHYLVELFRELQLLTSDYLRQRALYALQDLVTRFLTEDSEMRQSNEPTEEVYRKWIGTAAIEQTPSESFATSDDEQQEAKALEALSSQIRNNDMYDYAEVAESGSTMSTPTSNQDPPFAAEGLGDTVINLDEALQKMRSYEERMAEARKKALNDENNYDILIDEDETVDAVNVAASENSSAYDVASETSSELQQPSIDTQKLDKQIKSIMMDLIPFLNEHMESHCSPKFLSELNSLIFKLAKQKEPGAEKQEFGRSFHRQLESVLKDSLCRFEGRSLKECGEDILINVSELLFNELAFFRLMQDLDRPTSAISANIWNRESGNYRLQVATSNQTQMGSHSVQHSATPGVPTTFYDSSTTSVGLLVNTSGTIFSPPAPRSHGIEHEQVRIFEDGLELQDVKENEENDSDAEDEIEAARQSVNVELSVSESRPVASTGSGEEDVEEDQQPFPIQNIPPESSVGVQQQQQQQQQERAQQDCVEEQRDANSPGVEGDDDVDDMPEDDGLRCSPRQDAGLNRVNESESELEEDERGEDEREEDDRPDNLDDVAGAEREAHDTGNEDGDESEVTVDDLPTKLTGLTEADLQTRMQSEQNTVEGTQGILSHLSNEQELADESTIPEQQQPPQQQNQLSHQQDQQDHCDHVLRKESE